MANDDISFSHPFDHFKHQRIAVRPGTCFLLMPFSETLTIVQETIVEALKGVMTCTRADNAAMMRPVLESVIFGIRSAELIIADLTGRNANVFYEIGLAHVATKSVLLLSQSIEDVPFDLRGYHCHVYSTTSKAGLERLSDVVRGAALTVSARRAPDMLNGSVARTREIVQCMRSYLDGGRRANELFIRIQAGYSSIGNEGDVTAAEDGANEYGRLLEEERDGLIALLDAGAALRAIIYPPVGPWPRESRAWHRYERLLRFLRSRDDLLPRVQFVFSVEEGSNLMFFGKEILFEGHKTSIESGYGWTMVYSDAAYVHARLTVFDMLFESARRHTMARFGDCGAAGGDARALRDAVADAVLKARDGTLPGRWADAARHDVRAE